MTTPAKEAREWWIEARADLRILRQDLGIKQWELARTVGTTQGNIAYAERGGYETAQMCSLLRRLDALSAELVFVDEEGIELVIRAWDRSIPGMVRSLRGFARLTQDELAAAAGCSRSTVQSIEDGPPARLARPLRPREPGTPSDVRVTTFAAIMIVLGMRPRIRTNAKEEE